MQSIVRVSAASLALALALSSTVQAQSNEEKFEAKLQKDFVKNAAWVTDYDEARKQAKTDNKLIFAYFTRSYQP